MLNWFTNLSHLLSEAVAEIGRWLAGAYSLAFNFLGGLVADLLRIINQLIPAPPAAVADACGWYTTAVTKFASGGPFYLIPVWLLPACVAAVVTVALACVVIKLYMRALSLASFGGGAS